MDVSTKNGIVTAHCPNTGSMKGLLEQNNTVWISETNNKQRKLKFTWELLLDNNSKSLIGINTHTPNKVVYEALENEAIKELSGYKHIKKEVKYGQNSRIDFYLNGGINKECYLEVKNVHYTQGNGIAMFPDAVTDRGLKHLKELGNIVDEGKRAIMLYIVQREDCEKFKLASDIDAKYYEGFLSAVKKGVEVLCYSCRISLESISIGKPLKILDLK